MHITSDPFSKFHITAGPWPAKLMAPCMQLAKHKAHVPTVRLAKHDPSAAQKLTKHLRTKIANLPQTTLNQMLTSWTTTAMTSKPDGYKFWVRPPSYARRYVCLKFYVVSQATALALAIALAVSLAAPVSNTVFKLPAPWPYFCKWQPTSISLTARHNLTLISYLQEPSLWYLLASRSYS